MARNKTGVKIQSNTGGPAAYAGYIQGIASTVDTDLYIGSALNYMHADLANMLDLELDQVASAKRSKYHHLYEQSDTFYGSNTVGDPTARLWTHVIAGRGRSKIASFVFQPSVKPVPVNPILTEGKHRVKEGVHVFEWKAPVFEYGIQVEVEPKLSPILVFLDEEDVIMTPFGTSFTPGENTDNEGAFTEFFFTWWTTVAPVAFERSGLRQIMEKDVASRTGITRATTRAANKGFALNVRRDSQTARNEAYRAAQKDMRKKSGQYIDAAAARRWALYGV